MHYLYLITNKINGKVYVGQSNNNRRWSQHKYFARYPEKTGQYIHRAMAKYGIENFTYEVIVTCKDEESTNVIEDILIIQYNSRHKDFGYNLNAGGFNGAHSEETKEKIRLATIKQIETKGHPAQGNKWTEEQKTQLSETLKALDKSEIYTEEVKQRMSEAHIGTKDSDETKQIKALKAKLAWQKRQEAKLATGELKCNAPGCDANGIRTYLIVNNIRYCGKHGQRLKLKGTLELKSR